MMAPPIAIRCIFNLFDLDSITIFQLRFFNYELRIEQFKDQYLKS